MCPVCGVKLFLLSNNGGRASCSLCEGRSLPTLTMAVSSGALSDVVPAPGGMMGEMDRAEFERQRERLAERIQGVSHVTRAGDPGRPITGPLS